MSGEAQAAKNALFSLHSKVEPASLLENVVVASGVVSVAPGAATSVVWARRCRDARPSRPESGRESRRR